MKKPEFKKLGTIKALHPDSKTYIDVEYFHKFKYAGREWVICRTPILPDRFSMTDTETGAAVPEMFASDPRVVYKYGRAKILNFSRFQNKTPKQFMAGVVDTMKQRLKAAQ